jgi:hypothetical protein
MPRDILSEFGKDSPSPQAPRATNGGQMEVKPIPYDPPKGPSNIGDAKTPGLHGTNIGVCGTQGKY